MNYRKVILLFGLIWLIAGSSLVQAQEIMMADGRALISLDIASGETERIHTFDRYISNIAQNSNNELFVLSTSGENHDHTLFRVDEDYSLHPLRSFNFWVDQMLMLDDDLIILIDNDHNQWWTVWYTYSISRDRLTSLGNISSSVDYIGYHPLSRTLHISNQIDLESLQISLPGVDQVAGIRGTRGFEAAGFYAEGNLYAIFLGKLHLVTPEGVMETGIEFPYYRASAASKHLIAPESNLSISPPLLKIQQEIDYPTRQLLSLANFSEEPIEISGLATELPINIEVQLPVTVPPRETIQIPVKFLADTPGVLSGELKAISVTETVSSNLQLSNSDFDALEEEDFAILGTNGVAGQLSQNGQSYNVSDTHPISIEYGFEIFDFNTDGELFAAKRDELYQMDPITGEYLLVKQFPGEAIVTMTFLNTHEMLAVVREDKDYQFELRRINLKYGIDQSIMPLRQAAYRELEYNPADGKLYLQYSFEGALQIGQIDLSDKKVKTWWSPNRANFWPRNIAISASGDVLLLSESGESIYMIDRPFTIRTIQTLGNLSGADLNIINREAINFSAIAPSGATAKAIPNPASRGQTIALSLLGQSIQSLRFTDLNGRAVPFELEEANTNFEQGIVTLLPKAEPGLYVLYLTGDFGSQIVRVVIRDNN